jgi:hypothetical protein
MEKLLMKPPSSMMSEKDIDPALVLFIFSEAYSIFPKKIHDSFSYDALATSTHYDLNGKRVVLFL